MATSSGGAEAWSLERIVHALGSPSSLAYRSDEAHGTIEVWDRASHLATLRCTLDESLLDVHAIVELRAPWGRQPAADVLIGLVALAQEVGDVTHQRARLRCTAAG